MKTLWALVLLVLFIALGDVTSGVEVNEVNKLDKQAYVGSNVELECDLDDQDAKVSWRKVVGRLSDESEEASGGRLVIYDVSKEDAGEYECFDENEPSHSHRMRLVVLNGREESSTQTPVSTRHYQSRYKRDIEAETGGSIELFCEFKDEPELEWRKVDGEISPHKTIYGAPDNRLALHFLSEEDEGTYECVLPDGTSSSVILKVGSKKSGVNDDVFKPNTDDYNGDYPHENIQTINANPGSSVKMICEISNSNGDYSWRKIAGIIGDNSEIVDNRLELTDLTAEDSGIYECSSENLASVKFHLIVNDQDGEDRQTSTTPRTTTEDDWWGNSNEEETTTATTRRPTTTEEYYEESEPVDSFATHPIGSTVEIVCALSRVRQIQWTKLDDVINSDRVTEYGNRLIIRNLKPQDAGVYQCQSYETRNVHRTRLDVIERPAYTPDVYPKTSRSPGYDIPQQQYCREDEATCGNGQCIPRSGLCNGYKDCADGTDEIYCSGGSTSSGYNGKCQPNENSCRSDGKCIPKIWYCDGEKECKDGSDEESCTGPKPGGICQPYEFLCRNRNQCVYKSFLCDNERDCQDGSDEMGCVEPKVTQPPIRTLTVCLGATFKLECRAVGFPVPFINWRLNWGHVCPEPRCWMVTDETGFGVFTVTDARWEDAGAYSCEAISTKGREFAIPDTIVRIELCQTTTTTTTTTTRTTTRRTTTTTTTPQDFNDDSCLCYGHSDTCTCSNICHDCQHNTNGTRCEKCLDGYTRYPDDPYAPCYPISAPRPTTRWTTTTTTTTRRTTTPTSIFLDEDCEVRCHNHSDCTCSEPNKCYFCRDNTMGERCEQCKPGYTGDPTRGTPYDCVPIEDYYTGLYMERNPNYQQPYLDATTRSQPITTECNQFGTAQIMDGNCKCKPGVVGTSCDECAPKFFHLVPQKTHKKGCISCFCNGLEVDCASSELRYGKLEAKFDADEEWQISDRFIETKLELDQVDGGVEFTRFNEFNNLEMYFLVPIKFKGNKLASYGGKLEFTLTVRDQFGAPSELKPVEIRISGAQVNIVHMSETPIEINKETKITLNLVEDNFKRYGDKGRVDRDHLMMALSDIRIVMIRASYTNNQESIRLSNFSIDVASEDTNGEGAEAKAVEVCQCPAGYSGNSCEVCAPGYQRSGRGFYLGLCEPV